MVLTQRRLEIAPSAEMRRHLSALGLAAVFVLFVRPLHGQNAPSAGEITLPLDHYLQLVERASELPSPEPTVATVTSQRTQIVVSADGVRTLTIVNVLVEGEALEPVPLAIPGTLEQARCEPADGSSIGQQIHPSANPEAPNPGAQSPTPGSNGLSFFPRASGRYRLELRGRLPGASSLGFLLFELPPSRAPLHVAEIALPAELDWSAPGAVLFDEALDEDSATRRLVLALPSELRVAFAARRLGATHAEETVANTVTATRVEITSLSFRRTDAILYEIPRGSLPAVSLEVPRAVQVDQAVTSHGPARLGDDVAEGPSARRLRVEPAEPLSDVAFLRLEQPRSPTENDLFELSLEPIRPAIEPRARYLLLDSTVAADLLPLPADNWQRVDLDDLPAELESALPGPPPVSVWRWAGDQSSSEPALRVATRPLAPFAQTIVRSRRSTTLLTPEVTWVQRERLTVQSSAGSFVITVSPDAVVWMARVGGVLVRPVISGSTVRLPLTGSEREPLEIELVTVSEGAVPLGRSQLDFALPSVTAPVLTHEWRLLLPEEARYRFVEGTLLPVSTVESEQPVGLDARGEGSAAVTGTVRASGQLMPGVTVTLEINGSKRQVVTDALGRYAFDFVEPGHGTVTAQLEGFSDSIVKVRLRRDTAARASLDLQLATSESIYVTSEAPIIDKFKVAGELEELRQAQDSTAFGEAAGRLRQGTVGGVRPLAVEIPERGKVLLLSGVLPPARVSAKLEARRRQ